MLVWSKREDIFVFPHILHNSLFSIQKYTNSRLFTSTAGTWNLGVGSSRCAVGGANTPVRCNYANADDGWHNEAGFMFATRTAT